MNIILKGPRRTPNGITYAHPDIEIMTIDHRPYDQNKFNLKQKEDGDLYLYHSYSREQGNIIYSGRYYDLHFKREKLIPTKGILSYQVDNYEDETTGRTKPVTIRIHLTPKGQRRLARFMSHLSA